MVNGKSLAGTFRSMVKSVITTTCDYIYIESVIKQTTHYKLALKKLLLQIKAKFEYLEAELEAECRKIAKNGF